jgi:outer membrane protein with beta-barrel domain
MIRPTRFRGWKPTPAGDESSAEGPRTLCRWCLILGLGLGALAGRAAPAQGVTAARQLVIEVGGQPLGNYLSMALPDTMVVTVQPRDSLGNPVAVTGFEVQVWDRSVFLPAGTMVERTRALARFVPRKRGQTAIQIQCSGLRQWIRVEVGPSVLAVTPQRTAPPTPPAPATSHPADEYAMPVAGGRVSYAAYEHTFHQQTSFDTKNGFVVEGSLGRDFDNGVVLVGGAGFGLLRADSLTVPVTVHLLEVFFRLDYRFMAGRRVSPVVSAGGGAYRIRTGGTGSGIWNTSLFWTLGAGGDVAVTRKMTVELRATTQLLEEINSGHLNGHVGNLFLVGAGVRFQI